MLVIEADCYERMAAPGQIFRQELLYHIRVIVPRLVSDPDANVARRGRELMRRYLDQR
ncbi:MAG: hypothetical protein QHH07_05075 [Sedimentisphaerales bacterium]|nr:hypothetical protein [Sedimentisphaerales bacterium]